jgi:Uma2 family endonuclease
MTSTLQVHPPSSGDKHRFTVEDYYKMVPAGILEEDSRVELLEGHVIPMAPIGPEHLDPARPAQSLRYPGTWTFSD